MDALKELAAELSSGGQVVTQIHAHDAEEGVWYWNDTGALVMRSDDSCVVTADGRKHSR